ncbi:MAG: PhnD/SsuA/transferrin family substrate-binding protein [Pseudomonadota bacterium]
MPTARLLRPLLLLCLFASLLPAAVRAQAAGAGREYTVAVIPIMPPAEVKRRFQPLLDEATRRTGLRFRFHFYKDFKRFEQGLAAEEVDFTVASPVLIWQLRDRYRPILRGSRPLIGQVVVRRDSPLQQLSDLGQRSLGYQEGGALSTNLFVLRTLREQKVDFLPRPLNTESSALRSAFLQKNDAALVNNYLMQLVPANVAQQLRVIHSAPDLPPPAIMAGRQAPPEVVQKFRDALLALRESHPALLASILMPDLTEADIERDYGVMARHLGAGDKP